MKDIQKLYDQVHWYEGMLLSAQHFQQNNLYFEQLMVYRSHLQNPYSWGVMHLEIDRSAIDRGKLEVTQLIAIMPDGTIARDGTRHILPPEEVLSEQGSRSKLLSLDLTQLNDIALNKPFYVYLAIPHLTDACASDSETEMKRYDSVKVGKVVDQNDIRNSLDIERLKPRVQLVPESQFNEVKFSGFKLAKIEMVQASTFSLLSFMPALLVLNKDPYAYCQTLVQKLDAMLYLINEKASMIRNYFADGGNNESNSGLQRQRIYHLTAQLPAFNAVYLSDNVTPFALYQALVQMAGHMAPLTSALIPPAFIAYDHHNPMATFEPVIHYIESICNSIHFDFSGEPFALDDKGVFAAYIEHLSDDGEIYLACTHANGSSIEKLKQWMESATIASESGWEDAIFVRSVGASRQAKASLDTFDLSASDGEIYFVIQSHEGYIKANQTLYIKGTDRSIEAHRPQRITHIVDKRNG